MRTATPKIRRPRTLGRTTTLEVLGAHNHNHRRIRSRWAGHHRVLTELREQFLKGRNAQSETAKERFTTSTEHIADAATDSYDRDCALALLSSSQNALYEIDQALQRIADGSYGVCESSGRPIERARLRAIPWTRFGADAQAQLETHGGGGRVQLGELGTCLKSSDGEVDADDEPEEGIRPTKQDKAA